MIIDSPIRDSRLTISYLLAVATKQQLAKQYRGNWLHEQLSSTKYRHAHYMLCDVTYYALSVTLHT